MEGGLHGNSGTYGGAGEGEGGTGGYLEIIEEAMRVSPVSLREQYEQEISETEIGRIKAEAELEKSKTEFLKAQVGLTDPAKIELSRLMPKAGQGMDFTTLAIIGVAFWYFYKGGK